MNQCVPRWNLEDNNQPCIPTVPPSDLSFRPSGSNSHSNSTTRDVSLPDYEVAELTWENGNLSMQGLGLPRVSSKPQRSSSASPTTTTTTKYTTCDQKHGTLESIVNQATQNFHTYSPDNLLVPLIDNTHHHPNISSPVVLPSTTIPATTVDALVPTPTTTPLVSHPIVPQSTINGSTCVIAPSTRVGSCSGTAPCPRYDLSEEVGPLKLETSLARVPLFKGHEQPQQSVSLSGGSNTFGWDSRCVTLDTCDKGGLGLTTTATTSFCSPGNTSSAAAPGGNSHAGGDDHDFVCHSKPQQGDGVDEEQKKKGTAKSSASTKRSRAAAVHNQSERKRRNKINQKMDELQKLVPNSNKTDKASMLDEAIEYLKQLQAQFHMMSRMSFPSMMMPLAMQQQQLQMSMMAMAPMGMGMGMDLNSMARQNIAGIPHPSLMNPQAFMPLPTWDGVSNDRSQPSMVPTADPLSTYLGYHSQPMTMDAYSRMAALYNHQLMQQRQGPGSNS